MSALVIIFVVLVVLGAAAVVLGAIRRQDTQRATSSLGREATTRDRKARKAAARGEGAPGLAGRDVERAAVIERRPTAIESADPASPATFVPPDPETYDVTRRQFLNRSAVGVLGLSVTTFAAGAFTAFLWPTGSGGFGGQIKLGKLSDIKAQIVKNGGFLYAPEGRMWITQYPESAVPKARVAYAGLACLPGMEKGIVAIYQKCVHLGCRVPACQTSKWFECPCHGSQYNQVGEKKGGPAPRGLDRFPVDIGGDGSVTVDTASAKIIQGPAIGTNTTGQEAEGPHCI